MLESFLCSQKAAACVRSVRVLASEKLAMKARLVFLKVMIILVYIREFNYIYSLGVLKYKYL